MKICSQFVFCWLDSYCIVNYFNILVATVPVDALFGYCTYLLQVMSGDVEFSSLLCLVIYLNVLLNCTREVEVQ